MQSVVFLFIHKLDEYSETTRTLIVHCTAPNQCSKCIVRDRTGKKDVIKVYIRHTVKVSNSCQDVNCLFCSDKCSPFQQCRTDFMTNHIMCQVDHRMHIRQSGTSEIHRIIIHIPILHSTTNAEFHKAVDHRNAKVNQFISDCTFSARNVYITLN